MGLKLFRTTEYSSSSLFTHTRPQAGLWPATLLVISGLWLAGPGNVALWRAVAIGTSGTGVLLAVALGAGIAAFVCALLSLVAWRGLLKPAVSVLLMLSAAGTYMLLSEAPPAGLEPWAGWKRVLLVLALFIVPMLWVWRAPVRLISPRRQFTGNAIILAVSLAVLAAVLWIAGQNLQALVSYKPGWACMINPAAAVLKLTGQCAAAQP
ncbi:MAG: phosphoethanolamine transferase domain-containing protein [Pseudomonadota bacterium]